MILRDVLRQVVLKMGMEKDVAIDDKVVGGDVMKKLLLASNNVIRELASCYFPLLSSEKIKVENNRFDLQVLPRQIVKIVSLKDGDRNVRYTMYPTYMYVQNGLYDLVYSYLPESIGIDGNVECDVRISSDILSNGIVSEYALMTQNIELATLYDRKYRDNLKNIAVTRREIRIKGRAFV